MYDATYTMHGVTSSARTNPNPSVVIVFTIGFDTPNRLRRITSHMNHRAIAVTIAVNPDHLVAIAAPPAAPAANRYGRHNGAGQPPLRAWRRPRRRAPEGVSVVGWRRPSFDPPSVQ